MLHGTDAERGVKRKLSRCEVVTTCDGWDCVKAKRCTFFLRGTNTLSSKKHTPLVFAQVGKYLDCSVQGP